MSISKVFTIFIFGVLLITSTVIGGDPIKQKNIEGQVKFYVYTRQNPSTPQALEASVESVVRNILNPTKPTT